MKPGTVVFLNSDTGFEVPLTIVSITPYGTIEVAYVDCGEIRKSELTLAAVCMEG